MEHLPFPLDGHCVLVRVKERNYLVPFHLGGSDAPVHMRYVNIRLNHKKGLGLGSGPRGNDVVSQIHLGIQGLCLDGLRRLTHCFFLTGHA